jgi:hypothetical protein
MNADELLKLGEQAQELNRRKQVAEREAADKRFAEKEDAQRLRAQSAIDEMNDKIVLEAKGGGTLLAVYALCDDPFDRGLFRSVRHTRRLRAGLWKTIEVEGDVEWVVPDYAQRVFEAACRKFPGCKVYWEVGYNNRDCLLLWVNWAPKTL